MPVAFTILIELKINGRLQNVGSKIMSLVPWTDSPSAGKEDSNNITKLCTFTSFYITFAKRYQRGAATGVNARLKEDEVIHHIYRDEGGDPSQLSRTCHFH